MSDILLRTGQLGFAYPARSTSPFGKPVMRDVIKSVDLAVPRGAVLGLVGESGSGKTTLGRLLVRLLEPTSGGIQFDGTEISHLSEAALRPLRARIQMIFQDPQSSLNPRLPLAVTLTRQLEVYGRLKVCRRRSSTAIRTSSPVASASAPASRGLWRCSRTSSSPMRSSPAATSPPRRIS